MKCQIPGSHRFPGRATCAGGLTSPCDLVPVEGAGHISWGWATLRGRIIYGDRTDQPLIDDDFNWDVVTTKADGALVDSQQSGRPGGRHLEHSDHETVGLFNQIPFWVRFESSTENGRRFSTGGPAGLFGIAIGMFSIDGAHYYMPTEIHSVHALALRQPIPFFPQSPETETWVVFFRKTLSQGACGRFVVTMPRNVLIIPLITPPTWRPGATRVVHSSLGDKTQATRNSTYAVAIDNVAKTVTLTINLDDNPTTGDPSPWFAAEILLNWDVPAAATESLAATNSTPRLNPETEEFARLPAEKLARLKENLEKLAGMLSQPTQPSFPARYVSPAEMPIVPPSAPMDFRMLPVDTQEVNWTWEALRNALGSDTPPVFRAPMKPPGDKP
ncbi:MAG: hypothetical protein ACJ76N_07040 [Thermoanaerobaculia bacterium]